MMIRVLRGGFLLTLCMVCMPLPAQEQTGPVKMNLMFVSSEAQIRGLGLIRNQAFQEMWIPAGYVPEPFEYEGAQLFSLVTQEKGEEGEVVTVPAARVILPKAAREVIVLLAPAVDSEKTGLSYDAYAINVSRDRLPNDSFWVWNMSGRPILGSLGHERLDLQKGERRVFRPVLTDGPKALDAKLMFADDETCRSYTSTKWFLNPGQRFLMMLIEEEDRKGHPSIRVIPLKI